MSSGCLQELKNKRKFQTLSSKSGCSRLREVVVYKRFQIQWFHLETFGILESGPWGEVAATEGLKQDVLRKLMISCIKNETIIPNSHSFFNIRGSHLITKIHHKLGKLLDIYHILCIICVGIDYLCTSCNLVKRTEQWMRNTYKHDNNTV